METKQKFIKVGDKIIDQYIIECVDAIDYIKDKAFFTIHSKGKNQFKIIESTHATANKIREKLLSDLGYK